MLHITRPGASSTRGHNRTQHLNALGPCVYAVRTPEGLIKIGHTSRLGYRVSGLGGVESIIGLRLGGTWDDEQAIHDHLDGEAVQGREWYTDTPPVVAVVNEMRSEMGMPPL